MSNTFTHPNPLIERISHYGALALIILMAIAVIGQILLALSGLVLLLITGAFTLLLIAPVVMFTTATPAVTVDAAGITVMPVLWRHQFIEWSAVTAIKPYPLLPPHDAESGRKALEGRRRYRSAEGIMLVIPSLPLVYRITGLFAGEGFTGVIALTNRSHTDYERLVELVRLEVEAQQVNSL